MHTDGDLPTHHAGHTKTCGIPPGLCTAPKVPDQGKEAEVHNPQPYYHYNHIQLKPLTLRTAL